MKKKYFIISICLLLFLSGCFDLPLTTSRDGLDTTLIGYWKHEYSRDEYSFNSISSEFLLNTNLIDNKIDIELYHITFSDSEGEVKFISFSEGAYYIAYQYQILSKNKVKLLEIDEFSDLVEENKPFKNTKDFQEFVKNNFRNPSIYSEPEIYTRITKKEYCLGRNISDTVVKIDFNGNLYIYPVDNSIGIQWYNGSFIETKATSTTDGAANTDSIVKYQGAGAYAAYLCDTLTAFGHNDWYLPAKDELNALYQNKATIGGFSSDYYWSSTEPDGNGAWGQNFSNGNQYSYYMGSYDRVRCVRRN